MTNNSIILLEIPSLFTKLIISFLLYLFINYVYSKKQLKALHIIRMIVVVIILRDILFTITRIAFMNVSSYRYGAIILIPVSDIIIITLIIAWIGYYTKKRLNLVFPIINFILTILFVVNLVGDDILRITHSNLRFFYWMWVLSNQIFLATQLFKITEFNTTKPQIIILSRRIIFWGHLITGIVFYLIFWQHDQITPTALQENWRFFICHILLLPAYSIIYYIIVYNYNTMLDRQQAENLSFVQKDLESLFEFLRVLSSAMVDKLSLDEILKYVTDNTVKSTGADAGAILMIDDYEDILKVKAVSGFFPPLYSVPNIVKRKINSLEAYFQSTPIRIGETILGEAVSKGQPIYIRNSFNDKRMKANTLNDTLFVSSVIIMPLVISKRVLGVLSIINRERGKFFVESDFEHLRTFAEFSSLAIDFIMTYMELLEKKEMEREIGIAADIQNRLLPKKLPKLKNSVLEAFSTPAKGVSGDYWDVLQLKGDKTAMVICDVAGKGVPAALVMVMVRSILHLIASSDREVATLLTWVNRGISGQIDIDHYATMSILFYNQITNELTYANAAHHPLLIYRNKTKTTETLDTEGLPIGIEKTTKYGQKKTKLNSGDVIVMYTDGIIEAMNYKGEQYSTERFTELIASNAKLTPKEIIKVIKADLASFVGNSKQHDDQTLLLMKVN